MSSCLPAYEVRISARAKHPQIRIIPPNRVEVVIPQGLHESAAARFVASKSKWIESKLALYEHIKSSHSEPTHNEDFPKMVHLAMFDRSFRIEYRTSQSIGVRASVRGDVIILSGAVNNAERVRASLKRWLLATARTELPPMLNRLAARHEFNFRQCTVRYQKQRWGSCSSHRHIILNAKLICLPKHLACHVMFHELAHLKHFNHSRSFWSLLNRLDQNAKDHHAALRIAWLHLPAWLQAS